MPTSWSSKRRARQHGGTLLVAISIIAALSVIGGTLALSLTSRSQLSSRSASWHEAGAAAESGIDIAVAEIRRVLPAITAAPASPWNGWTGTLPTGRQLPAGVIRLEPPSLVHAGEGNQATSAVVTLEAPTGTGFPSGWLRVRAVGTALLTGHRQPALSKLDTPLRHFAFTRERADIVGRGNRAVSTPEVARALEVIVRPVYPFEQAMLSGDAFTGSNTASYIDSFDSSDRAKSTLGLYDSNKRQQHGSAFTLGTTLGFAGKILGDAGTNGGALVKTARISGSVNNSSYQAPPAVAVPAWAATAPDVTRSPHATVSVSASLSSASPARYRLTTTSGKLSVSGDFLTRPTYVEIYASGNISGDLVIAPGVQVSIYAAGNVQYAADDVDNYNSRASSLQVYGVQPASGASPAINLTLGKDLYASIYAPGHALRIGGTGDLFGSAVARSIDVTGALRFHYDEALATQTGPVIDYRVASWIEDVR